LSNSADAKRGIDHLVLPVSDLDVARQSYERLGFTCTPDAYHPFGTKNFLVQLQGSFLEILAVHDRGIFPAPGPEDFSFPRFNDGFLARNGEGFSMLVMDSNDPGTDRADFMDAGLNVHAPFSFGRVAVLPDGTQANVGFELTFVTDTGMPDCGFFTCHQVHPPELFWKPDYQRHANTARSIKTVVLAGEDWRDHVTFLEGFTGTQAEISSDHARFRTLRGDVVAGTPVFSAGIFCMQPPAYETLRFLGYEIQIADFHSARDCLDAAGLKFVGIGEQCVIFPSDQLHGVPIAFSV